MTLRDRRSIVAVDPTPRGVAFVFFDRGELLDWGHRRCGRDERDVIAFVEDLLVTCGADLLILEDTATGGSKRRPRVQKLLRALANRVRRGVAVLEVSRTDVRERWKAKRITTKEAVAAAIAHELPELQAFVPPLRKPWMSEHPHVKVFDAAALVLHTFPHR